MSDPDAIADGAQEVASDVRPYTVTGGRTRTREYLAVEAVVEAVAPALAGRTREEREILALCAGGYLSVAELGARLHLPVGVVRVLVGDLAEAGHARVHAPVLLQVPGPVRRRTVDVDALPSSRPAPDPSSRPAAGSLDPAAALALLEGVLHGISAL